MPRLIRLPMTCPDGFGNDRGRLSWRGTATRQARAGFVEPASSQLVATATAQASRHIFHQQHAENSGKSQEGRLAHVHPLLRETTMATQVKPIPEGYHTVTPYLVVDGAEK